MSIVGAVAVRVRPDATGFREELKRDVMRELRGYDPEVEVGARLGDNGRRLKNDIDRATRTASQDVKIGINEAFLKRDLARVRLQVERFSNEAVEIGVNTDKLEKSIAAQRNAFSEVEAAQRQQQKNSDKLADATERLTAAHSKLADVQGKIDAGDKTARLAREYDKTAKSVADLEREIERLKKQNEDAGAAVEVALKKQVELAGDLADVHKDAQSILDAQEKIYEDQSTQLKEQLEIERRMNTVRTGSRQQLIEMLREQRQGGEELSATFDRVLTQARELDNVEFSELRSWAADGFSSDRVANLRVEADTALAEAELRALERTRSVRILAYVDSSLTRFAATLRSGGELDSGLDNITQKYKTMFLGGGLAASGVNTVRSMTSYMAMSAAHMDKLAYSSLMFSQGIGAVVGTLVAGTGLIAKTANDLGALTRGAVIAPALLASVGVAAATSARGLSVLGDALGGNVAELESIAPAAVPAVNAVRELFSAADTAGKERFFAQMLSELESMPATLVPISRLWEDAYESQGKFFGGVLGGINQWNSSGDMSDSVGNIAAALENASAAGEPFTQILLDMVTVGSEYMPGLADDVARLANNWADYIRVAKDTGQINEWIEESGRQLIYLDGIAKGTVGIVRGLGTAAAEAGIGGLSSFSDALQKGSEAVNTPLWQHGLTDIFRGANDGAALAGAGMGKFLTSVMDTSAHWEDLGRTSGNTMGTLIGNFGVLNRESRFLPGVTSMFEDMNSVADRSEGFFINLGNAMGDGAMLAGKFGDAGFQIADAFMRAWGTADKLTGGLADLIPVAGGVAAELIGITHAVASPLLDGLGALLSFVSDLPQPLLIAGTAMAIMAGGLVKLRSAGNGNVIAGLGAQFQLLGAAAGLASDKVTQFRGGWSTMTDMLRNGTSFESAGRYLSIMDRNFGSIGRNAAQAALGLGQISGAISGANFSNASDHVTRFSTALTGVKNVGVAGLRGSLGSLVGFLGGPWGVALAVAGAAVAVWAAEVAEAKRHAEALQTSLSETGDVTSRTAEQLTQGFEGYGNAVGNWFDKANESLVNFLSGEDQIWQFEGAVKATGKTMSDLGADVAKSGGDWSEYRGSLEEANRIIDENGSLTAEQATQLFGTADAANITGDMFRDLRSEWDKQNNALKDAKRKHEEFAAAMGLTSREASVLKESQAVLNNEFASTSERATAAKDVLDVMNGSTRSFLNSMNTQEQSMGGLTRAFQSVAEAGKGGAGAFVEYSNALGETSWRLDTTISELGQLDSALQQSYDTAVDHAQAVYDTARAHGKSVGDATAEATGVMSEWRSTASSQLQQMGADAQQAEAYLTDIAGEPWTVEVTFMGKAEEYMKAQTLVEKKGKEFNGQAFTAYLKANPDAAASDIERLVEAGFNWSSSTYEASLLADGADAQAALDEVIARGQDFTDEELVAYLEGDTSSFLDAVIAAKADGEAFHTSEWRSKLGIDSDEWDAIYPKMIKEGEEFGSQDWVARMDIENPGFAEKFYAAEANLLGLTEEEWVAHVTSNVGEVKDSQDELLGSLQAMNGTTSEVTIVSNAATEVAVAEVYRLLISGMDGQEVKQQLKLNDEEWRTIVEALPGDFSEAMETMPSVPIKGDIEPLRTSLGDAVNAGKTFSEESYTAGLDGNNVPFKESKLNADGVGLGFSGNTFTAALSGNNLPFAIAKGATELLGMIFGGNTFTAALSGDNSPFNVATGVAAGIGAGFARSVFAGTLRANDYASSVVRGLLGAAWNWGGSVFTATFKAVASKLGFADGGIVNGSGVQTFANGGVTYPRESHYAMIAAGATPYRVWAEPETGGEAYIPLSSSKRERSTAILGEVADKFGLTVTKHFADGGVDYVGGMKPAAQSGGSGFDAGALGEAFSQATERALRPLAASMAAGSSQPVELKIHLDGREVHTQIKMLERKFGRT